MKIESHLENLKESINEIGESITKDLTKKERTLGFHTSAAAMDILEIILHKNNLIDPGFIIKHKWFNSDKKIKEKFPFHFDNKERILNLIKSIESIRNNLCYGKRQEEKVLEKLILDFNKLKRIFNEETKY